MQKPLEKSADDAARIDKDKRHPQELCEKCQGGQVHDLYLTCQR